MQPVFRYRKQRLRPRPSPHGQKTARVVAPPGTSTARACQGRVTPDTCRTLREKTLVQEARAEISNKLEKQNQNTCPAHAKRSASTLDKTIDALRGQVQDIHLRIITPTTEATMVEQGHIKRDDPRWLTQSISRRDTEQWTSQSYPQGIKAPYTLNALLGWYDGHRS